MNQVKYTLAIETAIQGGSVSILDDRKEIAFWIGGDDISRSADLVYSISRILEENKIERSDIDLIAYSDRCGSSTGLRVARSTALGLQRAFNCKVFGISPLKAIAIVGKDEIVAAITGNGRDVFYQSFRHWPSEEITELSPLNTTKIEDFLTMIFAESSKSLVVNEPLWESLEGVDKLGTSVLSVGRNLSRYIGEAASSHLNTRNISDV